MAKIDPRDCEHLEWKYTGRWSKVCAICGQKRFVEGWEYEDEQRRRRTNYFPPRHPKEK
jgi:hypothetical protein